MTETKLPYSIPQMLLHLFLLAAAIVFFNPLIGIFAHSFKPVFYYTIVTLEVCIVFFFFSIKRQLKIDKFIFIIIVSCSFINMFGVFSTLQCIIENITMPPHKPYLKILYKYVPLLFYLPLPTYLAGYLNKKLFLALASMTIAGFAFSVITFI